MNTTPTNYTPLHLELMIHYHSSYDPFPRENSVIIQYRDDLIRAGLIELAAASRQFKITERGRYFVAMLCATPLPTRKDAWADPRSKP